MLTKFIHKILKSYYTPAYIENVFNTKYQQTVLISYLTESFRLNEKSREFLFHQNRKTCLLIAQAFKELGFNVDVVNYNAKELPTKFQKKDYKVIFGLGDIFWHSLDKFVKAKHVYFATGLPAKIQNQRENLRVAQFNKKHAQNFSLTRSNNETIEDYKKIDFVVGIGNANTRKIYRTVFSKKMFFINSRTIGENSINKTPFSKKAIKHFLYHSGKGKVFNGLDLLLDIFKRRKDIHLHITTTFDHEEDFEQYYYDLIHNTSNIHFDGYITVGTDEFKKVINSCQAIIAPIAAAGQTGAVLTAMSQGLIPITTKEANIDINKSLGFIFNSLTEKDIEDSIDKYLKLDKKVIEKMARKNKGHIKKEYSSKKFKKNIESILKAITKSRKGIRRRSDEDNLG